MTAPKHNSITNEMRVMVLKELFSEWQGWEDANGSDMIADQLRGGYHKIDGDNPIEWAADYLGEMVGYYYNDTAEQYHKDGYTQGFDNAKQWLLGSVRHAHAKREMKTLGMTFEHFLDTLDKDAK